MSKYAIYKKWQWPNGVPEAETMQDWQRGYKKQTKAVECIWFKVSDDIHQSVLIYQSEADAKAEQVMLAENRKKAKNETGHKMLEETMGPVLSIMSEV